MTLLPYPPDEELLRIHKQRTQKRGHGPITPLVPLAVAGKPGGRRRPRQAIGGGWSLDERRGEITITIAGAPRTKKNHKQHYAKESPAYRHWRDGIVKLFGPPRSSYLPLPPHPLNMKAVFYVDSRGKTADLVGLLQGLADALENAGVVENDNWFRAFDGSRIRYDQTDNPRAEVAITPLNEA